jgi:integrase
VDGWTQRPGESRSRTTPVGSSPNGPASGCARGEDYTSLLEHHLVPPFGARALAAITPGQVREWYETLAQTQPGRAHKAYRLLRTIMNTAVADRLIITSPCVLKGAGQDRSAERPVATVAQVDALAAAVPERYRLLVELAAWCSLRYGELTALRRGRLDLLHGTVEVREALVESDEGFSTGPPKIETSRRTVAIPPHVHPVVAEHLERFVGPEADALVFTGSRGGRLRRAAWSRIFRAACRHVGVDPGFRFHDLRHTGNTLAAATGASTRDLMARMGHASMRAAVLYQHASADRDPGDRQGPLEPGAAGRGGPDGGGFAGRYGTWMARHSARGAAARAHIGRYQHKRRHPQRDSDPCFRLERAAS